MTLDKHTIHGSHYGFSATRVGDLGAAEYTLVTIAADVSGSVGAFDKDIERSIKEVVRACRHSPRADNLMLRLTTFDHQIHEVHGFKPLPGCNVADYDGCLTIGGTTALYDAAHNAIEAMSLYGATLSSADFDVNGIVFVVTDGMDNASSLKDKAVAAARKNAVAGEHLESLTAILVGVNISDPGVSQGLDRLRKSGGFDQYIEIGKATAASLAKLAAFVSRSISAQSQALGSGSASVSLSF